jgi:hypothetical protein
MHANIILKVQGDAKHQFACAIKLALNSARAHVTFEDKAADLRLEHEELKRELAAQRSQLKQFQDITKKKDKVHKQFGAYGGGAD